MIDLWEQVEKRMIGVAAHMGKYRLQNGTQKLLVDFRTIRNGVDSEFNQAGYFIAGKVLDFKLIQKKDEVFCDPGKYGSKIFLPKRSAQEIVIAAAQKLRIVLKDDPVCLEIEINWKSFGKYHGANSKAEIISIRKIDDAEYFELTGLTPGVIPWDTSGVTPDNTSGVTPRVRTLRDKGNKAMRQLDNQTSGRLDKETNRHLGISQCDDGVPDYPVMRPSWSERGDVESVLNDYPGMLLNLDGAGHTQLLEVAQLVQDGKVSKAKVQQGLGTFTVIWGRDT